MVVLPALDPLAPRGLLPDRPRQTALAAAAVAREDLHPIQRRHDPARHLARPEDLVALQPLVDPLEHRLQRAEGETAVAVPERVLAEGGRHADPVREEGIREIGLQLMEAPPPKHEAVEDRLEDGRRGDRRRRPPVPDSREGPAEREHLVDVLEEAGERLRFFHIYT